MSFTATITFMNFKEIRQIQANTPLYASCHNWPFGQALFPTTFILPISHPFSFSWILGWRDCVGQYGCTLSLGLCRHRGRRRLSGLHGASGPQCRWVHGSCGSRQLGMFRPGRHFDFLSIRQFWLRRQAQSCKVGHENAMRRHLKTTNPDMS